MERNRVRDSKTASFNISHIETNGFSHGRTVFQNILCKGRGFFGCKVSAVQNLRIMVTRESS